MKDCKKCKHYIGKTRSKNGNPTFGGKGYLHCRKGYSCDAFAYETGFKKTRNGVTYSMYGSK